MKLFLQTVASVVFGVAFFGPGAVLARGHVRLLAGMGFHRRVHGRHHGTEHLHRGEDARCAATAHAVWAHSRKPGPLQKVIIVGTILAVVAVLVISAFDHRFGWSTVPTPVIIVGAGLVFVGLTLAQVVVIQNNYAERPSPSRPTRSSCRRVCTAWCVTRCTSAR